MLVEWRQYYTVDPSKIFAVVELPNDETLLLPNVVEIPNVILEKGVELGVAPKLEDRLDVIADVMTMVDVRIEIRCNDNNDGRFCEWRNGIVITAFTKGRSFRWSFRDTVEYTLVEDKSIVTLNMDTVDGAWPNIGCSAVLVVLKAICVVGRTTDFEILKRSIPRRRCLFRHFIGTELIHAFSEGKRRGFLIR